MRALVYLHSRTPAVLHRDIKPANVLVFTSGGAITWKLGDVGIAKVLQTTRAGSVAGTLLYMAPDVLLGPYDGRVDVFSTGIMAAELVVRYMDIAGFERVAATQYRFPEHRPALVDDACARLDRVCPALSAVVRRCCAMMPADRIRSDAVLLALNEIGGGRSGGDGGGARAGSPASPAPRTHHGGGAVPPTSVVPAVQLIDMSIAAMAVAGLHVAGRPLSPHVVDRVCDAMTAVADEHGNVTGAQLLRIAVDEGIAGLAAMDLRRQLGIAAAVPPRRVRGFGTCCRAVVTVVLCALGRLSRDGTTVCLPCACVRRPSPHHGHQLARVLKCRPPLGYVRRMCRRC
jgi:hypothetical protein